LRQEGHEFEDNLGYIVRPCLKKKKKKEKERRKEKWKILFYESTTNEVKVQATALEKIFVFALYVYYLKKKQTSNSVRRQIIQLLKSAKYLNPCLTAHTDGH
jgi:hypothetical protein